MATNIATQMRWEQPVYDALVARARDEGRSINNMANRLLAEALNVGSADVTAKQIRQSL
jgi:hypothetical protein